MDDLVKKTDEIVQPVADVPPAIVHTIETAPKTAVDTSSAMLWPTLDALRSSIDKAAEVNAALLEHLKKVPEAAIELPEKTITVAGDTAEDIKPEIIEKPSRMIRRGNRRVKRG